MLDSRVYLIDGNGFELEIFADLLPQWDIATNLGTGKDQQLTHAQIEQAQWIWLRELEMLEVEEQGTDSA